MPELVAGGASWYLGAALDGGPDIDGDGVPDLLVSATGHGSGAGATWLVSGAAVSGSATVRPDDVALVEVAGDVPGTYSGAAAVFLGDVMGDGGTWYAVSAPYADAGGYAGAGSVHLFDGGERGSLRLADAEARVEGYFGGATLGNRLSTAGDVDGDGVDDYVSSFGAGDLAVVVPGGGSSPRLPDDALFRLTGTGAGETGECTMIGDLDGDGVRELACIEAYATLRLYMLLGADRVRTVDEASVTVQYGEGAFGDTLLDLGDLDGDGLDETFVPLSWSPDLGSAVAAVLEGSALSFGAEVDLLDAPLLAVASRGGGYGDRGSLVGDVDGDGSADIALGGALDDAGGTAAGGVVTIPVPE
ncbi:MAG: hypothetical protein ACK4YP_07675 [Myxococcota bacterium]